MHDRTCGLRKSSLALALITSFALPSLASANEAREAALEQRVADLERQLHEVMAAMKAQPPPPAAPAPKAAVAGKAPIQETTITPGANPNTTFRFGGFIKADFLETKTSDGQLADQAPARDLYLPGQIPVGGKGSHTDYDAHVKFSRINFGVDTITDDNHKMGAFVEMDFFGNALGTEVATNTYGTTLRHAYLYWDNWTAGQTWSNFMDTSALPDAVDFIGPTDGVLFVRQAQIRYTNGPFSVALENPETTYIPHNGGAAVLSDRGALPDLTLRYGWKGGWGTFGIGALVRDLKIDRQAVGGTTPVPGINDDTFAGAVTVGGKWNIGKSDDIRYQLTAGSGFSRYVGLGITADSELDAANSIDSIGAVAGYVAWRHVFSPAVRTNLMYARSQYDNTTTSTGGGVTKDVQSIRANVIYSPLPKVDVGAELMYGKRKLENGLDGNLSRLQFMVKYSF